MCFKPQTPEIVASKLLFLKWIRLKNFELFWWFIQYSENINSKKYRFSLLRSCHLKILKYKLYQKFPFYKSRSSRYSTLIFLVFIFHRHSLFLEMDPSIFPLQVTLKIHSANRIIRTVICNTFHCTMLHCQLSYGLLLSGYNSISRRNFLSSFAPWII